MHAAAARLPRERLHINAVGIIRAAAWVALLVLAVLLAAHVCQHTREIDRLALSGLKGE